MKIHIVQKGDTLWNLSKKYDVDFEQLKSVNSHLSNPDMIMPGMKIKVPTGGVPVKKEAPKAMPKKEAKVAPTPPAPAPPPAPPKEKPIAKEKPMPKEKVVTPEPQPQIQMPQVQMPMQPMMQPVQQQMPTQQQMQEMIMNFNIYKQPQQQAPVYPSVPMQHYPEPPKVQEKPVEKKPVAKKPVPPKLKEEVKVEKPQVAPTPPPPPKMPEMPFTQPMMQQPMQPMPCFPTGYYPVSPVMSGCSSPGQMVSPYQMQPSGYPMGMAQPVYGQQTPYGFGQMGMQQPMMQPQMQPPQMHQPQLHQPYMQQPMMQPQQMQQPAMPYSPQVMPTTAGKDDCGCGPKPQMSGPQMSAPYTYPGKGDMPAGFQMPKMNQYRENDDYED
ncbi:SafA/ExsA family spore coat assembly protein [Bacillus sp. FJAT-45350]|uniref:SafA/ExsA family spore coat assembly protein n=1 Tax=Bacillus sp. FJAT-45350 TaxID=2011014 RepID=UPI000BB7344C|nr:SafA/ExsA family spore coat assembly protein [Bacillus sp. FJAT-45350]